jgi:hypothetical protein
MRRLADPGREDDDHFRSRYAPTNIASRAGAGATVIVVLSSGVPRPSLMISHRGFAPASPVERALPLADLDSITRVHRRLEPPRSTDSAR